VVTTHEMPSLFPALKKTFIARSPSPHRYTPFMNSVPKPSPPITHVALIGHCGFDGSALIRLARQALPEAQVDAVNHQKQLDAHRRPQSLLLVNRVLDGRFDAADGIELIRQLAANADPPRMMLISNYDDAQAQAVEAGALLGFGKSQMGSPASAQRLRDAAG